MENLSLAEFTDTRCSALSYLSLLHTLRHTKRSEKPIHMQCMQPTFSSVHQVGTYLDEVADVDDERVGHGPDADPLAVGAPPDVEPPDVVLVQDGQGAGVLVPPHAEGQVGARARRVVVQPDEGRLVLEEAVQPVGPQLQAPGDQLQQLERQLFHRFRVLLQRLSAETYVRTLTIPLIY
uniref:Uncharacterized protein n=1 Tax=Zea mays TaxID=4577 RepID=C4IY82_MAIZE|nr:unknown [Zea mays]